MEDDNKKNQLVRRPGSELDTPGRRTNRVREGMTRDVLARAKAQDVSPARFRIGDYLLRGPDYRQILRWAEAGVMRPEEVLERLAETFVTRHYLGFENDADTIRFSMEDGAIISLPWNFDLLPFIPDNWESGLWVSEMGFKGKWTDPDIPLRPDLPTLKTLVFTSLMRLDFISSQLKIIDLSKVPELHELIFSFNEIDILDLSQVPKLAKLDCGSNKITKLDLTSVPGLTHLVCEGNELSELNLFPVPGLIKLACGNNNFTKLDLKPVPRLANLNCGGSSLIALDLSSVSRLTTLHCTKNKLTELDLSPVPRLTQLFCMGNNLHELDLSPTQELDHLLCDKKLRLRNVPCGLKTNGDIISWASTS